MVTSTLPFVCPLTATFLRANNDSGSPIGEWVKQVYRVTQVTQVTLVTLVTLVSGHPVTMYMSRKALCQYKQASMLRYKCTCRARTNTHLTCGAYLLPQDSIIS